MSDVATGQGTVGKRTKSGKRRSQPAGAAVALSALLLAGGEAHAKDGEHLVRLDSLKHVVSVRLNADGSALLTMADGSTVTVAADMVQVVEGVAMIAEEAAADLGLAAGGGISVGLIAGGAGLIGGIIAVASGGGDGGNAPPANTPPSFTSGTSASVAEGQTAAYTAVATDAQNNTLTYSLSGTDAALFDINTSSGAVTFKTAPDFENPADAGRNNVYDIVVTANDGTSSTTQNVAITVTDRNDNAPVFTSGTAASAAENQTTAYTATATDADAGTTLTYSLSGADAALFAINAATGVVTFKAAPDFEAPGDAGANNVYDVIVTASDGTNSTARAVAITVTNVNDNNPVFTSGTTVSVAENQPTAYTAVATDADAGTTLTYSLSGADAALFNINASTGVVAFKAAPDFEAPGDAGANNVYDVIVTASDGTNSTARAVAISVTNLNDNSPVFTSGTAASVSENQTGAYAATATDADAGTTLTYSLSGTDAALFNINAATGVVAFKAAPDFETPGDAGANNVYDVVVTASDGTNSTARTVVITVTNLNDNSPVFTSGTTASATENQTAAFTATATDADAGTTLTYSLSGTDAALFNINAATGVVAFKAAPDFETPGDAGANNVYDVVVTASDGTNSTTRAVAISVTNVNDNSPVFTSGATASVAENQTAAYTTTATDADAGTTLTYSLSGTDAALFNINAATGAVTFKSAPDFEAPADADGNNVYDIVVTASDGTNSTNRAVAVAVTNLNDNAPQFTSGATATVAENLLATGYIAAASDADGNPVTFGNAGGIDAGLFAVDPATGALSFVFPPDFEAGQSSFTVDISASDGTNSSTRTVVITLADVNDNSPIFTIGGTASAAENQTSAFTATATDADAGTTLTYALSGTDAALFNIDAATGVVAFRTAPDFEAPADAGGNNVYNVIVTASDGTNSTTRTVAITVTDLNDNSPVFTSGTSASVAENQTAAYTVVATDADAGTTLTYSLSGTDAALFNINASTGVVTFKTAPDFEAPGDAGANNVYDVIVTASDGTNSTTRAVAISVTNVAGVPDFSSGSIASIAENSAAAYQAIATDEDRDAITFSISGADAALFNIDPAIGAVTFKSAPDFETPGDANRDNVYEIVVTASDKDGSTDKAVAISVTNLNDNAPVFTSGGTSTAPENTIVGYFSAASDGDGDTLTYSLSGTDAALFRIVPTTGLVLFLNASDPDFENPSDANGDNVYDIVVTASDGTNSTDRPVAITVRDTNDNRPVFTSGATASAAENGTAAYTAIVTDADTNTIIAYSLSGADAALFNIDARTGVVTFKTAPDFENPSDANRDNVYDVVVTASDVPGLGTSQAVAITVTNVNDNSPVITSGASASLAENQTAAYTAIATDADTGTALIYSLSGTDSSLFDINAATGVVTFKAAPDFEAPADANRDNVYDIVVTASDGSNSASRPVAITITNANDNAPVVISAQTSTTVQENSIPAVYFQISATDADGDPVTLTLAGPDAAHFQLIAGNPGEQNILDLGPFDFENPLDANGDNIYELTVIASDGTNTSTRNFTYIVSDRNDNAPVFTSGAAASPVEGQTAAFTAVATDADAGTVLFYAISGTDAALFDIDGATGAVSFKTAPDFEAPSDANGDNVYDIVVTANDGTFATSQAVAITVTNLTGPPVFTSAASVQVNENSVAAYQAVAFDDEPGSIAFGLSGADAALFDIDAATGAVTFKSAPDFEAPADAGANNVYNIVIAASNGVGSTNQAVAITVANINDNAPVFTSEGVSSAPEGSTTAYASRATDDDGDAITYSLSGTDAALFNINASTGVVTFKAAADFEAPGDAGANNVYDVIVTASDGINSTDRAVAITVTNLNDNSPVFTSAATASAAENQTSAYTAVATDADAGTVLTYSLSGTDAGLFNINASTGVVTFKTAPDFEAPGDAGGNNLYDVIVTASDGTNSTSRAVAISVTNVNDNAPLPDNTSVSINVAENRVSTGFLPTFADADGDQLTFSIGSAADGALFRVDPVTGELLLRDALDFERAPVGVIGDPATYFVSIIASDGVHEGFVEVQVNLTDVNEAPVITSGATASAAENQTAAYTATATDPDAGATLSFSLSGTDAALFNINAATGAVTFKAAPNFEAPGDANGDNVYDVVVTASDGTNSTSQTVAISVTNVNDIAPVFTSGTSATIPENSTAAYTAVASDSEGDTLSYSLSGTDAALFSIDSATGAVTFKTAPDFENPTDTGRDNVYDVVVTANDGPNSATRNVAITVTNVEPERVVFTSGTSASAAENQTAAYVATATGVGAIAFGLSGKDAALFNIDAVTGAVTFKTAPDFENPADDGANNVYDVIVTATDSVSSTDQAVAITVTDVNEVPVFDSGASQSLSFPEASGLLFVGVQASDPEGSLVSYSLSGPDALHFFVDEQGFLTSNFQPDFENPQDADRNNVYQLVVTASDGTHSVDQTVSIAVTNVDEAPVFTSGNFPSVTENQTAAFTAAANDPEGSAISYSLSGFDAALFNIDPVTGVVTFKAAPDFEHPQDFLRNNVYQVTVTASDGTLSNDQAVSIIVTNLNDNSPVFTSGGTASVREGLTAAYSATATDADAGTVLAFSLSGTDSGLFNINSATGAVTFKTAPHFATPSDANGDNVYDITVTASDGAHLTAQPVAVSVTANVGFTATGAMRFTNADAGVLTGSTVTNVGDLDGDGADEVAVAAVTKNGSGSVYVVFGGALVASTTTTVNLDSLVTSGNAVRIDGRTGGDFFGNTIVAVGDMDGDGKTELAIAATGADGSKPNVGDVTVVYGGAILAAKNAGSHIISTATLDKNKFVIIHGDQRVFSQGPQDAVSTGRAIAAYGDWDHDGKADFILSMPGWDTAGNSPDDGQIVIILGSSVVNDADGEFKLGTNYGGPLFNGPRSFGEFGRSLAVLHDYNNDGTPEFVVGDPQDILAGTQDSGTVYFYEGDNVFNFPGIPAASGSKPQLGNVTGNRATGAAASDALGQTMATVADLDGDGFRDLVISAPLQNNGGTDRGTIKIFFSPDFASINGSTRSADAVAVRIVGTADNQKLGQWLGDAGDVDGDGKGDFLFSVDGTDGKVVVVLGSAMASLKGTTVTWQTLVDNGQAVVFEHIDTTNAFLSGAIHGVGDIDGDGKDDIVIGDPTGNQAYLISGALITQEAGPGDGVVDLTTLVP